MSPLCKLAERLSHLGTNPFPRPAYEVGLYQLTEAAFKWLEGQTDVDIIHHLFSTNPPASGLALEVYIEVHDGVVSWSGLHDDAE